MAVYKLLDFKDIQDAVMEALKYQSGDTVNRQRIKRDINMLYANEVAAYSRWRWLEGYVSRKHKEYYGTGTVSVTPNSTTVTLSTAPAASLGSFKNYWFSVDGFDEIYKISTHTAESTTFTIESDYLGSLNATASFKIWTDAILLPTDCRETLRAYTDFSSTPLDARGSGKLRELQQSAGFKSEGRPEYYSTDDYEDPTSGTDETESDRYRVMRVFPALYTQPTTIHIQYIKEVTELEDDSDEPLMPNQDKIVLFYGACALAWERERNESASTRNYEKYYEKLKRMAGKTEDSQETPKLVPDSLYLAGKRHRFKGMLQGNLGNRGGGGSTVSVPTYLEDVTINGATITDNVTVNPGVTIDGVDISVLDASVTALDAEIDAVNALADGAIYIGNAANTAAEVVPTGDVTITNGGVTAITAGAIVNADVNAAAAIAYSKLNLASSIVNADVAAAAAIARTKLADGTADHVVINSAAGVMTSEATLSPVRGGTGVANNAAATLTRSGNHDLAITTTGATAVTFPTSGTLLAAVAATTDNALARYDGTSGLLQNSTVTLGDTGAILNQLTGDVVALTLKANTSGQTVNVFELFRSNGDKQLYIDNNGSLTSGGFIQLDSQLKNGYQSLITFATGVGSSAMALTGTNGTADFLAMLQITANKAATRGLILKGAASQSANLKETRDSSDNVLNYENSAGLIQAASGFGAKRTTTAASYTVLVSDYFVGVTSNAAARTITLPAASACTAGQIFIIKDEAGTAASANNITIARAGSDTIDGATSVSITADYGVIRLYSDGSSAYFSF